ncbi:MAG TPA: glycosyltransferase family 4 protein [Roseiflexaceae bacterium]|nr:glycosyltransferase family 4 protein [Roseiflexaceae bacterium]
MNILILSPYPPYPPHGGGTMRVYQILRGLAARHTVTCLTFAADEAADRALEPLRAICHVRTIRGSAPRATLRRAWTTLASPLPDMALRNASDAYAATLRELLAAESFDVVQAESIEMAGYIADCRLPIADRSGSSVNRAAPNRPLLILDQFNAEYVLQKRAALTSLKMALRLQTQNPRSAIQQLAGGLYSLAQWLKLARYERRVMRAADAVAVVSEEDARALRRLAPAARFAVVPNGVDTRHFSRVALAAEGLAPLAFDGPALVFSGTLDYRANVDALAWFAGGVLPRIRQRRPDVRLIAVGKRPTPALQRLAAQGALTLTGEVPDARPFIAGAAVYVVPMRIGGGVRLKLLEALALEAPTVTTSLGAEGVMGLRNGEHCLVADEPAAFAAATLRLLDDPALGERLGAAGRELVCAGYDWAAIVPCLEDLYQELGAER